MNWRARLKRWIYGSCPGFAGSFSYFGTRVFFPKGSHIFEKACESGVYERDNLKLLAALVRPGTAYLDVGANIGLLSIPLLHYFPTCRVVSFEPSPNTLPYLRQTQSQSGFGDRWQVVGKAVGSRPGELEMFTHAPGLGAYDSLRDIHRAGESAKHIVPVTTIDAEWEALARPVVSVIKIDVEGAEMEALRGAVECFGAHRPNILLEWNAENLEAFVCAPESLLTFARETGYELLSLPDLALVEHAAVLRLKMLATENFLLVPNPPGADWNVHYGSFRGLRD